VYQEYNRNTIEEIKKRRQFGDFILAFWGWGNKPICDAFEGDGQTIIVEPGIGYCSTFAQYRIFESYTMLHLALGMGCCQQSGGIPAYSTVIPNYFDPKDFEFREIKKDYFLCLGRISKCKGVDHAIEVTAKIGARLVIAGQGSYKDLDLEAWPDHVEYVGYALPEKRKELMKNAKGLFILSTYIEPFGGAMVESFFCGTPVISSDIGSFVENNLHGITGYRCRTFGQMVWAAQNIDRIDPKACLNWAQNFTTERIAGLYEEYFQSTKDGWYGEVRSVPLLQLKEFPRVPKKQNKIAIWMHGSWALGRYSKAMMKYLEADFYDWSNYDDNSNLWIHGAWKQYDSIISNTSILTLDKLYGIKSDADMTRRFVVISFFPVFEGLTHFVETLENFSTNSRYAGTSSEICKIMRSKGVPEPTCVPLLVDIEVFPVRHIIQGPIKRLGFINAGKKGEYAEIKGDELFNKICEKGGYEAVHIGGREGYIYHDIDALICCSKYEGGPNGIFEAASSGVPVLTRIVGCAQDVEGIALFDTAEDAIHIISRWNSNLSELKEYTLKITNEVRSKWGLKTCIEKYLVPILNTLGGVPELNIHFQKLSNIVKDTWKPGQCGSYLIGLDSLDYDVTTYPKQKILYDICKKSKNFLEIGMYMGHSALLALLAKDDIKYTGIDICYFDWARTETCAEYMRNAFGERFTFLKGSSIDILPTLQNKYDVIHVDGNHNPDFVKKEIDIIIENKLLDGVIIFDDYDMIKSYIDNETRLKIIEIAENCSYRNCVCVLNSPQDVEIMGKCSEYTMTCRDRKLQTLESVEHVIKNNIPGDFVEIGVWRGGSVMLMLYKLLELGVTDRIIHLYDTFTGMTEPSENDIDCCGRKAEEIFDSVKCESGGIEEVKKNIGQVGYPMENIKFHEGDIRQVSFIPDTIAILRLDNDWYDLYKFELPLFEPKVSPGGVITIDDYNYWSGCKKAVDDYLINKNVKLTNVGFGAYWYTSNIDIQLSHVK
jgi:glycosyltransferase involved in cell wall biosynthesis